MHDLKGQLPNGLLRHTLREPPGLRSCETVLDVGAGIRPMQWYRPKRHVCIEPYPPYVERLQAAGFEVLPATAHAALRYLWKRSKRFEAVYLLDVIEHMTKADGATVLWLARQVATVQVVIFTPNGFMPQTTDNWGFGGHEWQTHRSGWVASDFAGWSVSYPPPKG